MVTVNHKLEALDLNEINDISHKYLMGWSNLQKDHKIMLRGLNKKRVQYGLNEIKPEDIPDTQIKYINEHYSKEEQRAIISEYMHDHLMNDARWDGFELFNCLFLGKRAIPTLKKLLGETEFKKLSEEARLFKIRETQTEKYGGVGLANPEALNKSLKTKHELFMTELELSNESNNYDNLLSKKLLSQFELYVYKKLISKFGIDDVKIHYGRYPLDDRYPYDCDFYIKSNDLFIEMNGFYSHNDRWFDSNDPNDLEFYDNWVSKGGSLEKAANNWRYSDIEKKNVAKSNNLNYLVFWDGQISNKKIYEPKLRDFNVWFYDYDCNTERFLKDHKENTY